MRPLDPAVSVDSQLSHCVFDPKSFACNGMRLAGSARDVETVTDFWNTYTVWADDPLRVLSGGPSFIRPGSGEAYCHLA